MSSHIRIYVDFVEPNDKTDLFIIKEGTTTFRDIENQFLEIPEFNGKQIYGIYNDARLSDFPKQKLSTPPRSLESPLDTSILIITDLGALNKNAVTMYNFYNKGELGFKYAQRNSDNFTFSTKFPFIKKTKYKKSPNIKVTDEPSAPSYNQSFASSDDQSAPSFYRPSAPSFASSDDPFDRSFAPSFDRSFAPSFASSDRSSSPTSSDTITKEEIEIIKKVTSNDFDLFQVCLSNMVDYEKNCLSDHPELVQKLQDKIFGTDLQEIIYKCESIEGVIDILNKQKKGGRRKSQKKPRRKSFRQKKRRSTHHKKYVSRR